MAETLLFFAGTDVEVARAAAARGERVCALSEAAAHALMLAGAPCFRAMDVLGDDPEMALYRAAADWTKGFGASAVNVQGTRLREALRYRNTTLWWWAELYLHHNTDAVRRVRFIELVARVLDDAKPVRVRAHGLPSDEMTLLRRLCNVRKIAFEAGGSVPTKSRHERSAMVTGLLDASKIMATAAKPSHALAASLPSNPIVFVSHAAFWRTRSIASGMTEEYEHYFDGLLAETKKRGLPTVTLGVGPQNTFRTRSSAEKWRERLSITADERFLHINNFVTPRLAAQSMKAFGQAVAVHRTFRGAHSLNTAFSHQDVAFADLSQDDLAFTLLHQVPWAARCLLEFEAAFQRLRPKLVCLYAESSGLGRAAIEAARETEIKTLGVQHGILYPNYFSYERFENEVNEGSPIPDVTAMYGEEGVRVLERVFRYPKGHVVATGSPRYDDLAVEIRKVNREERRANLGVGANEKLIVLASRYKGIRDTHKASGPAFSLLLDAIHRLEGARLIVKPHPAEPVDAYAKDIMSSHVSDRVRVISDRSLIDILPAADLLVTVESLSATEALVAGIPVVILRHPSNLREVVTSGAAHGVADGADPLPVMEALLTDKKTRDAWRIARDAYLVDVAHGVDGKALERLISLLSAVADGKRTDVRVPTQ
ncbi:MAG: CDP-glycerol glycerophosphotransferase family protein [Vicinamibacteria bacterium]